MVRFTFPHNGFLDVDHEIWNGISYDDHCGTDGLLGFSDSNAASVLELPRAVAASSRAWKSRGRPLCPPAPRTCRAVYWTGQSRPIQRRYYPHSPAPTRCEGRLLCKIRIMADYRRLPLAGPGPALRYDLGGLTASFNTASAFCYIPEAVFTHLIIDSLGFEGDAVPPSSIDSPPARLPYRTSRSILREKVSPSRRTTTRSRWFIPGGPTRCVTAILPSAAQDKVNPRLSWALLFSQGLLLRVRSRFARTIGCK